MQLLNEQEIADILKAQGCAGIHYPALVRAVEAKLVEKITSPFNPDETAVMVDALKEYIEHRYCEVAFGVCDESDIETYVAERYELHTPAFREDKFKSVYRRVQLVRTLLCRVFGVGKGGMECRGLS